MRRLIVILIGLAVAAGPAEAKPKQSPAPTPAPTPAPAVKVLVLHDAAGPYEFLGSEYTLMLRNLLGHFPAQVTFKAVSSYVPGEIASMNVTFYVGSTYEEPSFYTAGSPQEAAWRAFLSDVAANTKPVVWMGFNLWRLDWGWDPSYGEVSFAARFGFTFVGHDDDTGYDRVAYKGVELGKGLVTEPGPGADVSNCRTSPRGAHACAPGLGVTSVVDPSKAAVKADALSFAGARKPYVVRGGNLWYIGDIPFSYITEEDRYLAMADLLHDMVGIQHPESHTGLVRLEDVSSGIPLSGLQGTRAVLDGLGVPYGVAAIPFYKDPMGYYTGGMPEDAALTHTPVGREIWSMARSGASIVQHGTTHQWEGAINPYNLVSGDDFEFFRVTENADHSLVFVGPVQGDSAQWATDRINQGRAELTRAHVSAFAWEAPHYAASATDYTAIRSIYPVHYGRLLYAVPNGPPGRVVGQFYPYPVRDTYGYEIVPENLADISPTSWNGFPPSLPADVIRRASKALVVRDGFASFFFHPYLDPSLLDETLRGIQSFGYQFVRPCTVRGSCT